MYKFEKYLTKTLNIFQNLEHVVNTLNKIERLLGLGGEPGKEEELSGDLVISLNFNITINDDNRLYL